MLRYNKEKKGYTIRTEDYNRIQKQEDHYFLPDLEINIDSNLESLLKEDIKLNLNRPTILRKHNISCQVFDLFLEKHFFTKKITKCREILLSKPN